MKHILILLLALITLQVRAQKIIGSAPPKYIDRVAVKPDTTIFASNNTEANLSSLTDTLGGRNMVTLVITKGAGTVNPTLPPIADTLLGTKFKVKVYSTTGAAGMFDNDSGFTSEWDGTNFIPDVGLIQIDNLEEYTFWPIVDGANKYWAYSETHSIPATAITGTARIIPYMNSSGRLVTGNNYFKLDTTITSGAQARVRLLINNPNGDAGEGDSYSVLSVRAGDALGSEAITNFGDQALTQGTTGYGAVIQLFRSGGNFTTKSNLSNGNEIGKFAWRGYVNAGSRALGHIQLNYRGDGTTILSDLIGATGVSGSIVNGWKLDEQSRFWLGSGADDYYFPTTGPSVAANSLQSIGWAGNGSTATPSFYDPVPFISSGLIGDNSTDGYYKTTTSWGNQFYNAGFRILNAGLATTSGAFQSSVSDGTNSATSQLFVSSLGVPKYTIGLDYGTLDKTVLLEPYGFNTEAYYAGLSANSQAVTTYQIDGQRSIEHITDPTITTINLPEIVGNPVLNQVGVGFILYLSVNSATSTTINVSGGDTIVIDGVIGAQLVLNTTGLTGFAKKLVAVGPNSWAIYR